MKDQDNLESRSMHTASAQQDTLLDWFRRHKVVVILPVHNEERYIGSMVLKLKRYPLEVVVVDDGSSDETAALAELAGARMVRLPHNLGKGSALNAGFALARELDCDVAIMLDGDGQHRPEDLPAVIAPVVEGRADLVIGSRYMRKTSQVPLERRMGHWLINHATGFSSGQYASDSQSGYRAFSRHAVECCDFRSSGFSVESEMQFMAHAHNLRLVEVPITIEYHEKAKRSAVSQGMSVLHGIIKLTGQYRPLWFFGVPGFFMLSVGIVWGIYVVRRFSQIGELAVGYTLICVLLCVMGLILSSTGLMLHSIRGLLQDMLDPKKPN